MANDNVEHTMNIVHSLSMAAMSYARQAHLLKWPYVTTPNFEVQTQEIHALLGGQLIFFTPVVMDETLNVWEMCMSWMMDIKSIMIT